MNGYDNGKPSLVPVSTFSPLRRSVISGVYLLIALAPAAASFHFSVYNFLYYL